MSLADLSRRLGVSYDDLALIVTTQFINPNAALIPRLTRLNASFATIKELHDNLGTAADITASFIASLPAGLDATQYGGTSPGDYTAVVTWVTGADVYPRIMDIITITAPADAAADCSGADLLLRYANPDATANALTAADYTRLIRFIRLWRKLTPLLADPSDAASIQHTDDILAALLPAAPATRGGRVPGAAAAARVPAAGHGAARRCPAARHCPSCSPAGRRSGPPRSPARTRSTRTCSSPRRCCSRTRRSRTTATATT